MKSFSIAVVLALILPLDLIAQQRPPQTVIAVYGGTGVLSVKDEFISLRKYSGQFSTFGAEWGTIRDSARNTFSIEYQHGGTISNNHSEADVTHMRLYIDHQSFYRRITMFGTDAEWYLGPAGIMALHLRSQRAALRDAMFSDFMSLYQENAIALSTSLDMSLSETWSLRAGAVLDAIAIGLKLVDNSTPQKEQTVKVLFPWKNLNGRFELGVEYEIGMGIVVSGKYLFHYVRNTAWDDLSAAGDNAVVRLAYVW